MSKTLLVVGVKEIKCSVFYTEINAIVQIELMGSVNVGLQEFAVLHISNPMEEFEIVGKQEAGLQKESQV